MKLREGDLEFDFDDQAWNHVIKFDEHADYAKIKNLVPETRGVDFTGILSESAALGQALKNKLAWLGCKTLVTNSENYDPNALKLKAT